MKCRSLSLVFLLITPVITSSASLPDSITLAEFSVRGVLSRIQTYADVCTERVPSLAPDFSQLMQRLTVRVHDIAKPLLASYAGAPIMQGPTPKTLVDTYNRWSQELRSQLAGVDATTQCPVYLANYGNTSDEVFRTGLEHAITQLHQAVIDLAPQ